MSIDSLKYAVINSSSRIVVKIVSVLPKTKKMRITVIAISIIAVMSLMLLNVITSFSVKDKPQHIAKKESKELSTVSKNMLAQAELSGKLDDINTQLARINQSINSDKSLSVADKSSIKNEVGQISSAISGLAKESTVTAISSNLAQETNNLYQKVDDLQQSMQLVENQIKQGNYISADNLPFKVESVDIWNNNAYAAVFLGNHTKLMAQNDTQMGWVFKTVDYKHQVVVLENNQKQLVKIDLRARG